MEEPCLLLRRNTDACVRHADAQEHLAGQCPFAGFSSLGFHEHLALFRELECVADQIGQDLTETQGITTQPVGHRGERMGDELDVLLDHDRTECVGDFLENVSQAEGRALEFELVGFDFRKVEDVVQDPQEVLGRRVGDVDELVGLGGKVGLERKAGHVENRIHRRADLVTHVREEHGLRLGGLLGLGLGELDQFPLYCLRSVTSLIDTANMLHRLAAVVLHHMAKGTNPDDASVHRSFVRVHTAIAPESCPPPQP